MGQVIGIDLGTTNSCVAVIEGGQPVVIANAEGKRTTPSIIGFVNGDIKVGDPAKRQMITNRDTIYSVKRLIGKKYSDVKDMKFPFTVKEGSNGMPVVKIGDRNYTPQELSAMVLQKMKKTAEDYLGKEVTDAVITVPAYFNDSERTATKEAGESAGLKVLRIINEPTAAALAYGEDKDKKDRRIAVFDLGGGTFDISILELGDGVFEVKSTNGDVYLGGDNFDEVIVDYLVDTFKKDHNVDLKKDPMAFQRLREAAEKAKIELSSTSSTEINLPYIMPIDGIPQHLVTTLTKSKFEQLSDNLLKRLKAPCQKAIKDSGLNINDINEVILVGGSSRMPIVQQIVKDLFGKEPNKSVNPDEAVAVGAAIQGGILSGDVHDVLLLDVIPISMGIETMGNVMTKIIEGNTTIPTSKSQVFSTASDNQPSVEIHVLQGERPMAANNKTLGRFHLDGIPPAMRGIPQIEVTFDIDANGILQVHAHDKGTGKKQSIRIEGSSSLTDAEIKRMKEEAEANAESDKKEKEKVDALNHADSIIFNTEKQIKEFNEKLTEDEKNSLTELVGKLKDSHKSQDLDKIKVDMEAITTRWNEISTRIYSQSANQTPPADGGQEPPIQDVDFENVK
jgi:molecular chaperone DnaK